MLQSAETFDGSTVIIHTFCWYRFRRQMTRLHHRTVSQSVLAAVHWCCPPAVKMISYCGWKNYARQSERLDIAETAIVSRSRPWFSTPVSSPTVCHVTCLLLPCIVTTVTVIVFIFIIFQYFYSCCVVINWTVCTLWHFLLWMRRTMANILIRCLYIMGKERKGKERKGTCLENLEKREMYWNLQLSGKSQEINHKLLNCRATKTRKLMSDVGCRFVGGSGGVVGWELTWQWDSVNAAQSKHHDSSLLASFCNRRHGGHAGHAQGSSAA